MLESNSPGIAYRRLIQTMRRERSNRPLLLQMLGSHIGWVDLLMP